MGVYAAWTRVALAPIAVLRTANRYSIPRDSAPPFGNWRHSRVSRAGDGDRTRWLQESGAAKRSSAGRIAGPPRRAAGKPRNSAPAARFSFGPGRRNDVRRITRQKQPVVTHRLRYKAAHPGDALLQDGSSGETPAWRRQPRFQFVPDTVVRPRCKVVSQPGGDGADQAGPWSQLQTVNCKL